MLLLHKHHLHIHQRYSDQRLGRKSHREITTTTQSFVQRGGAAKREHCLREKWVLAVQTF